MDFIQAAARNLATWQDWQLRAHGLKTRRTDLLWRCDGIVPGIYLNAITLSPLSQGDVLAEVEEAVAASESGHYIVWDSWMELDLTRLGFTVETPDSSYVRPPSGGNVAIPNELEIEVVRDEAGLEEFEQASKEGFETPHALRAARWHVPASLGVPGMSYFVGRVEGRAVSVSIAVVGDGVVGVYGVATHPKHRRKGYGAAMTWAAVQVAPGLPAVLNPSQMGAAMYRSMGFREAGRKRDWKRVGKPSVGGRA
ncbi:MAG: GNAT family N-acetyltransferase [Chloroflexi bacterium]|nr:GNAT family N-acetyltransferase [Chloroflexota bacterium]